MRKTISFILAVLLLCSLTACGDSQSSSKEDSANMIEVPNVSGMNLADARITLNNAGFTLIHSNYDEEELAPEQIVVSAQSPAAGSRADPEKAVTLSCLKKCQVYLDLSSDFNLFLNTYDLEIYFDGQKIGTIPNGKAFSLLIDTLEGQHTLHAYKAGNNDVSASQNIDISKDTSFSSTIIHGGSSIRFSDMVTTDGIAESSPEPTPEPTPAPKAETHNAPYHSSNDRGIAEQGTSGVYAYKSRGMSYDIYYIIDMDEGYVYRFIDGTEDSSCDRVKIDSGSLNDMVLVTYHDGGDTWQNAFCFNWKNQPEKLIYQDQNGGSYEFYTTDLAPALELRDSRQIVSYEGAAEPAAVPEETAAPEETPVPTNAAKTYTDREVKDYITGALQMIVGSDEYSVSIDSSVVNVSFAPEGITVLAYQAYELKDQSSLNSWNNLVSTAKQWSKDLHDYVSKEMNRPELSVALYYCQDMGSGNVLLVVMNGDVFYDFVNGVNLIA